MEENKVKYNKMERAAYYMGKVLSERKEAGASEEYLKGYSDALSYIKYRGMVDRQYWNLKQAEAEKHE